MITETDIAWVAGVFDTKFASIQRTNERPGHRLIISIWDQDFRVIAKLGDLTGTKVKPSTEPKPLKEWMSRACGEHCKEKHVLHTVTTPSHHWRTTTISAAIILHNVIPYMFHDVYDTDVRRKIADTVEGTKYSGSGSSTPRARIKELARLGWELPVGVLDHILPEVSG